MPIAMTFDGIFNVFKNILDYSSELTLEDRLVTLSVIESAMELSHSIEDIVALSSLEIFSSYKNACLAITKMKFKEY